MCTTFVIRRFLNYFLRLTYEVMTALDTVLLKRHKSFSRKPVKSPP
jgi:hypothetical protein